MTARNPREVRDDLKAIARLLKTAAAEYEWAYNYAHSNVRRDQFGGGRQPGHSDPTGNLVASARCPVTGCGDTSGECGHAASDVQALVRHALEKNAAGIREARKALERTRRRMNRFRYKPFDLVGLPDPGPTISKDELMASHEAKARRSSRGEGCGGG